MDELQQFFSTVIIAYLSHDVSSLVICKVVDVREGVITPAWLVGGVLRGVGGEVGECSVTLCSSSSSSTSSSLQQSSIIVIINPLLVFLFIITIIIIIITGALSTKLFSYIHIRLTFVKFLPHFTISFLHLFRFPSQPPSCSLT